MAEICSLQNACKTEHEAASWAAKEGLAGGKATPQAPGQEPSDRPAMTTYHAKVKPAQVKSRTDEDIPMLNEEMWSSLRKRCITTSWSEPLASVDASDAQFTALYFVVASGLPPYTDFAVWGPRGARHDKRMRFAQHFMDTSGKWRAVEQGGPANLEVWRACWETFTVAALSIGIATPAGRAFQIRAEI